MPTSHEDCTCEKQCPTADFCMCMWDYERNRCVVDCTDVITIPPIRLMTLEARIDLRARNVDLARLGEFLGQWCTADVLIPAVRAREKISLRMDDATLGDVLDRAGLVVRDGPPARY